MPLVTAYHRPESLEEALELLCSGTRVALAGGTTLNADREPSDLEAVDLQALGLDQIAPAGGGRVRLGATATLDAVRRCDLLPDSLRRVARSEQPSTLRTLASVGSLVARAPSESLLLAALLAHDGRVEMAGPEPGCCGPSGQCASGGSSVAGSGSSVSSGAGAVSSVAGSGSSVSSGAGAVSSGAGAVSSGASGGSSVAGGGSSVSSGAGGVDTGCFESFEHGLVELLAAGLPAGALVTAVTVDPAGRTALARTGRTPADVPIVAAYGRRCDSSVCLALTGVADRPVLVDALDPTAGLDPAGDFRGSPGYRLHLARVLAARVVAELS